MSLDTASLESRSNAEGQSPQLPAASRRLRPTETIERWHGLYSSASSPLRAPAAAQFPVQVERLDDELVSLIDTEPEASLLLLIHEAGIDLQRYSVRHSLLVTVICELAARGLPDIDEKTRRSLRLAALTMNIGMTLLQDQLVMQDTAPTSDQRTTIQGHAVRGHEMLREMGVADPLWLQAVLRHHDAPSGPLADQPLPLRLARLIQRADLLAARMSPRKRRPALPAAMAIKGAYFDERNRPDEAGSLIVKALGIYPVGSHVQLASGEVAVVLRCGTSASKPVVASIISAHGTPCIQPLLRDTRTRANAIVRGVPPGEVRVRFPIARLLKLLK